MVASLRATYTNRIRRELRSSLTEDSTPHEVAASFSIGTFITMLPTLGTGLFVMAVLVYLSEWFNKIALFGSVVVFNPFVKSGVYAASVMLGFALLGPVDGVGLGDSPSPSDGTGILLRLLVGNTILAVVAALLAYVAAHRFATAYHHHQLPRVERTVDKLVDELDEDEGNERQDRDGDSKPLSDGK